MVENIMKFVAEKNNLKFNDDVKLLTVGNSSMFTDYLRNPLTTNKTKFGVIFCLSSYNFMNFSLDCNFEFINKTFHLYLILYNVTNAPNGFLTSQSQPWPKHNELTKLKLDLDNAYLQHYSMNRSLNKAPEIKAELQNYPMGQNRFLKNADVVSSSGAFYFIFPPMICFVVILLEIVREKDMKLRKVKFINIIKEPINHWIK
jgi:hypothetical protein